MTGPGARCASTLVALDIDGVLKPSGDFGGERIPLVAPYQGAFSVDACLLETLRNLGEIVWLTTWMDEAPECFDAVLPASAVLDSDDETLWWKYAALRDYLATRPDINRVIWIDDELTRYDLPPVHPNLTTISPHSLSGLRPADLAGLPSHHRNIT